MLSIFSHKLVLPRQGLFRDSAQGVCETSLLCIGRDALLSDQSSLITNFRCQHRRIGSDVGGTVLRLVSVIQAMLEICVFSLKLPN